MGSLYKGGTVQGQGREDSAGKVIGDSKGLARILRISHSSLTH